MLRMPVRFDSEPPASQGRASPLLGEHTDKHLSALGLDADRIEDLRRRNII